MIKIQKTKLKQIKTPNKRKIEKINKFIKTLKSKIRN